MSKINLSGLSLYNEGMIKTYIHFSFATVIKVFNISYAGLV